MSRTKIFLVQIPPQARPAVLAATESGLPGANIVELSHWEDDGTRSSSADSSTLLVLTEPTLVELNRAVQLDPASGRPRWAVVVLGRDSSGLAECVPPEEWNAPGLARVFRSAIAQYALLTENLRLRGDLKTVSRRICHDLRSPVGCVYTTADVLKELSTDDAAVTASMADIIKQSSVEISQLLDRVSFALWASADPAVPSKIDMGHVVASALRTLETDIEKNHATIALPGAWPEAMGVVTWLEAIWTNLLNNALQHGGPAPKIQLAWAPETGGGFRFAITDTGPGVPPGRVNGLFERFELLHTARGSGLGLTIVERLVTLQGGRCGHEQPPEGGARFYFTLPAPQEITSTRGV